MSGGPQVFLGATTFCLISGRRQISGRREAGPPASRPRCELRSARRLEARPGPAAAHGHRSQALRSLRLLPQPTAVAHRCGRQLCETVITFAGARSVFGETDGTIARQKHPFSALSWRAKASRVSRKRTEVLALVLTVSSRRASSSFGAKKFALLGLTWV